MVHGLLKCIHPTADTFIISNQSDIYHHTMGEIPCVRNDPLSRGGAQKRRVDDCHNRDLEIKRLCSDSPVFSGINALIPVSSRACSPIRAPYDPFHYDTLQPGENGTFSCVPWMSQHDNTRAHLHNVPVAESSDIAPGRNFVSIHSFDSVQPESIPHGSEFPVAAQDEYDSGYPNFSNVSTTVLERLYVD